MEQPFCFSECDRLLVESLKWSIVSGYVRCTTIVDGERYMHRILMKPGKDLEVDHINGNQLDNRRENLRVVTHQINSASRRMPSNKSGHRNIYIKPGIKNKYMVSIRCKREQVHIGYYNTVEEALKARDQARQHLFGSDYFVER